MLWETFWKLPVKSRRLEEHQTPNCRFENLEQASGDDGAQRNHVMKPMRLCKTYYDEVIPNSAPPPHDTVYLQSLALYARLSELSATFHSLPRHTQHLCAHEYIHIYSLKNGGYLLTTVDGQNIPTLAHTHTMFNIV